MAMHWLLSPESLHGTKRLEARAPRVGVDSGGVAGLDIPRRPFPGQLQPNEKGLCDRKAMVPINGGCWLRWRDLRPPCGDDGYEWKGDCYAPVWLKQRQPTSEPP